MNHTQKFPQQPQTAETLIHARWIIPVDGSRSILENHSLAIVNGRIAGIVPTADVASFWTAEQSVTLNDHALLPGFINTHGHAAMSLLRGLADDLPIMEWLQNHIWPTETAFVNEDFVYDGTRLAIAEMIRCGTTTFSDNYFFPNAGRPCSAGSGNERPAGISGDGSGHSLGQR